MAKILAKIGKVIQVEAEGKVTAVVTALFIGPTLFIWVLAGPGQMRGGELLTISAFVMAISALLMAYVILASFPFSTAEADTPDTP